MSYAAYLADALDRPDLTKLSSLDFHSVNERLREKKELTDKAKKAAATWLGLPYAKLPKDGVAPELVAPLSLGASRQFLFLPIDEKGNTITVAISDPDRALTLADDYRRRMGAHLQFCYLDADDLLKAVHQTWDRAQKTASDVADDVADADLQAMATALDEPADLLDSQHDAPIIRLINSILMQALKDRASDIHIEPFEKNVSVRFRIDGVLVPIIAPSQKLHAAMVTRLKVMSGMDISQKRMPQDGRFKVRLAGTDTDVRVSSLPTTHGERIVMRLLGRQSGILRLPQLGMRAEQIEKFRRLLTLPNGIVLICGPTGSGKTTSLYAGIAEIHKPDINIVTIEDPVEYQIDGISQSPVNAKIGFTFAAGLRTLLRQDPNVVVIGEIRDAETAQIAVQAALAGRLVLSTIHTNDAASTVTRLVDMGIEPFLVASTLRGVLAQRMVRTLHTSVKAPRPLDVDTKAMLEGELPAGLLKAPALFDPVPSPDCPTGFNGRKGIFELMEITPSLRHMIHTRATDDTLRAEACKNGMLTLYQEALLMAGRGETTLEEAFRVTRVETVA